MSPARRPLPIRTLAAALFSVIGGFLVVAVVAQVHARAIDRLAREVGETVAPRIDHLSAARGELHRADAAAREAVDRPADAARYLAEIEGANQRLRSELGAYGATASRGERPGSLDAAAQAIGAYQVTVARMLGRLETGRLDEARALRDGDALAAAERADGAVERLERVDSAEAVALGDAIRRARERAAIFSYSLHALAALVAIFTVLLVLRVVAGRARMNEERARLEAENQRLAELRAQELDLFAGRVAHDLKNPLAAIALRVAASANASEQMLRDGLGRIRANIARLDVLLDGLLDFARSGGRPVAGARVELGDVVRALAAELEPAAAAAHAELVIEPFRPVLLACPSWAATCVLGNLVRNALKYLADGDGTARRVTVRVSEPGARVRVEVEDTGPGIPAGLERAIFDPYVRGPDTRTAGLGLGLATVKRVVEAYGGSVGVAPAPGRGARFWFELPRAGAQAAEPPRPADVMFLG